MLINQAVQYTSVDRLSDVFAALADPTRRAILARLSRGEVTVLELAKPFDMSLPAISKHLKVLEHARLISRSRRAQWRPCKLETGSLEEISAWLQNYRQFLGESVDNLESYIKEVQADERKNKE
jgi:DNA-binding transcriptional ArsR family regulator